MNRKIFEFTPEKWKQILEATYPPDRPILEGLVLPPRSFEDSMVRVSASERDVRHLESAFLKIDTFSFGVTKSSLK